MDRQGNQAGHHSQAARYLPPACRADTKMTPPEAWYAADAHLKAGEIEKARELLPLMLASDRIVMGRKIAEKEAKAAA